MASKRTSFKVALGKACEETTDPVIKEFCKRYKKVHPLFATVVFIIVFAVSFGALAAIAKIHSDEIFRLQNQISQLQKTEPIESDVRANGVTYDGVDGKTALELLKNIYQVETTDYAGMGEFVTVIDGVAADDTNFWAFYVDGEMAMEGAGTYKTKNGEKIEWRLDEIQ